MRQELKDDKSNRRAGKESFFLSMLWIGIIGFGGGSALIPVIGDAVTKEKHFVSEEEYQKNVVAAAVTPGALPVEIAAGLGRGLYGRLGMVLSAICMALPGSLLTCCMLMFMSSVERTTRSLVDCLSVGITAFICAMLLIYIFRTLAQDFVEKKSGNLRNAFKPLVVLLVFIMGSGDNLKDFFGIDVPPLMELDTLSILAIAFFVILYSGGQFNKSNLLVSCLVSLAFVMGTGFVRLVAVILMLTMGTWGLVKDIGDYSRRTHYHNDTTSLVRRILYYIKLVLGDTLVWLLLLLISSAVTFAVTRQSPLFVWKGLLSSLISFGGGDAYLSVAKGMFVESGMISREQFYGNLIQVANLLPGSILCKILSGVGYLSGYSINQSFMGGILLWLAGFLTAVAGSGMAFGMVRTAFDMLENLKSFHTLSRGVSHIISGLLINIGLTLIHQNMLTADSLVINAWAVLIITVAIIAGDMILLYWKRVKSGVLLLFSTLVGFAATAALCLIS